MLHFVCNKYRIYESVPLWIKLQKKKPFTKEYCERWFFFRCTQTTESFSFLLEYTVWEWSKLRKPQRNQLKLMENWNLIWKTNRAISDTKSNFYRKMSNEHQQSARGKRVTLPTITYFNRTVKVLMEALSGVETKYLHLRVKRQSVKTKIIKNHFK